MGHIQYFQYISGYIARKVSSYYTKPKSKNVASYLFSMDCQPGLLKKAPGSGDRVVLAVVWDLWGPVTRWRSGWGSWMLSSMFSTSLWRSGQDQTCSRELSTSFWGGKNAKTSQCVFTLFVKVKFFHRLKSLKNRLKYAKKKKHRSVRDARKTAQFQN